MWLRQARDASTEWNLAKTAAQIAVFWSVFLFILPPWLVRIADALGWSPEASAAGRAIAVAVFALASALGLASGYTMAVHGRGTPLPVDAPRVLVVAGPYRWVRNPMAVAGLAQGAAVALWHGSVAVGLYVLAGGLFWQFVVRPIEERDLLKHFGNAFKRYRATVPLWIPKRPGGVTDPDGV